MKTARLASLMLLLVSALWMTAHAGIWQESSQADFADGTYNTNVYTLPTGKLMVQQDAIYDLNDDGHPDIIVCNMQGLNGEFDTPSYIYWGTDAGYDTLHRTALSTYGATCNAVADLNDDGYLDLVFSSYDRSGSTQASIYWGSAQGYRETNKTYLPTLGSHGCYIADLNDDHYPDLVFANYGSSDFHDVNSYIYWGGPNGYSVSNRTELPTHGGISSSVADLNRDGYLDLVFSNRQNSEPNWNIHSYIYWGGSNGYSTSRMDSLYTEGAYGNAVYDLNRDGNLDIVFCNHFNGSSYVCNSYIYWGDSTGNFSESRRTELPTLSGNSVAVADIDRDQWPDLVFANWCDDNTYDVPSYLYWGSPQGYSIARRTLLPTYAAVGVMIGKAAGERHPLDCPYQDIVLTGYGNTFLYYNSPAGIDTTHPVLLPCAYGHLSTKNTGNLEDRSSCESYVSSVFDAGQQVTWQTMAHSGNLPVGTAVDYYIRTGDTPRPDHSWSAWCRVPTDSIPAGLDSRYAQYKLLYTTAGANAPSTESVTIGYQPANGVAERGGASLAGPAAIRMGPNPFRERLAISGQSTGPGKVTIAIYNALGQLVRAMESVTDARGTLSAFWDGRDQAGRQVASGTYQVQVQLPGLCFNRRVQYFR